MEPSEDRAYWTGSPEDWKHSNSSYSTHLQKADRKRWAGKKKKKQSRISYNTLPYFPNGKKRRRGGSPLDLPGWRSSLSVASRSDFGHLLLLYFKLSICPFYCENGCMTIHHLTHFSLSPPLLDLCSRCAAGISVVDNLQDDSWHCQRPILLLEIPPFSYSLFLVADSKESIPTTRLLLKERGHLSDYFRLFFCSKSIALFYF